MARSRTRITRTPRMAGTYQAQHAGSSSIAIEAEESGLERTAGLATTAGMEICNPKSFVVNVPVVSGGLKAEASKPFRMLALGFDDGELKAEMLGHRLDT